MKIAVVNEVSSADKNKYIIESLKVINHEVINIGMKEKDDIPVLSYINTGLISAILINTGVVDFVISGCGTGQGYLNSVLQYPGISCGYIRNPLDAWLFSQINAGNCIALALNQGFGWAAEIDLKYIFEKLFLDKPGAGYPKTRNKPQKDARELLAVVSSITHLSLADIILKLPVKVIKPVFECKTLMDLISSAEVKNTEIYQSLEEREPDIKKEKQ